MLKPNVFLCLVAVSAMTLSGGESRSDGSSDDGDYNGTEGGIGSALFDADAGQSELLDIETNTGAETILGTVNMVPTALAYDPNSDVIYVCDGDSLYSVNNATGATTFIGTYFQNEQCNPIFESSRAVR